MTMHFGFTNFETHAAFWAIEKSHEDAAHWDEAADDKTVSQLANELHEWHLHHIGSAEGWHREMLHLSIGRVDWQQVATLIRDENGEKLGLFERRNGWSNEATKQASALLDADSDTQGYWLTKSMELGLNELAAAMQDDHKGTDKTINWLEVAEAWKAE